MKSNNEITFQQQLRSFPRNYVFACIMELFERLAFFGVRAIVPLYLVRSTAENGLGMDFSQKGIIFSIWAVLQCLIPIVSGGYTDRCGYRKSLVVAFTLTALGYLAMAQSHAMSGWLSERGWTNSGFVVFLVAACLVAIGTAIFKPAIQGTIAKCINNENSSLGWGVFYWIVNIGSALAPMCAAVLRAEIDWNYVFYAASIVTLINFLFAILLYKEPVSQNTGNDSRENKSFFAVLISSIRELTKDPRLALFLLIFSGFWLMFMQLWDLLPNFIDEWVDSSDVAIYFEWISNSWILENGQTKPEMIISIIALSIIIFVIPISWLIRRISRVTAILIGMLISIIGFVGSGTTSLGWFCCIMVFIFSFGEMICSPSFIAYVGSIAPKDKKALYMGYSNIPFAIGWAAGSLIGGNLYEQLASKLTLARMYMVDHLGMDTKWILDDNRLPDDQVMDTLASALGCNVRTATTILWDLYHPYTIWYYLGAVGCVSLIGMCIFRSVYRSQRPANHLNSLANSLNE